MRLSDASKYEILYDLPGGEYSKTEVGGIRTKTTIAGDSLEIDAFPILRVSTEARREKERRKSGKWQKLLNERNSERRFRTLAEVNFGAGDWVAHPTFDYGFVDYGMSSKADTRAWLKNNGYPMDDEDATRIMSNFIRRLKRRIRKKGGDEKAFKYIYVVETTRQPRDDDPDPLPPRYHYHMIFSGLGILTIDDINACWTFGYSKAAPVDMRYNGLEGLSKYFTKRQKGKRKWVPSKNLKQPTIKRSDRKISRARAAKIAADVQHNGREILETLYPGYRCERVEVKYSDFVDGAYIYARLRRFTKQ